MKRVFVAEDDAALSRGICMALQSDDLALIPYGTIREARLKARRRRHSGGFTAPRRLARKRAWGLACIWPGR